MTLREAEKEVLAMAREYANGHATGLEVITVVRRYESVLSAGKPKAKCYCGKTVSIEGKCLRWHRRGDDSAVGHAPYLDNVLERGGCRL